MNRAFSFLFVLFWACIGAQGLRAQGLPSNATITAPTGPTTVAVGTPVQFTGVADGGKFPRWNFGDLGTATGFGPVSHAFTSAGTYNVTFSISADLSYDASFAVVTVTVVPGCTINGVTITPATTNLVAGGVVGLSGSLSSTGFGCNLGLAWSTNGGTLSATSGPNVTWTAPSVPGTYTVTATSAQDPTKSATATVTVTAAVPTLSSFAPASSPIGTSVTLTGTNFTGASAVSFNGTAATFTVISATQITATVPVGTTTGTISVTTPGGTATSSGSFTVTIAAPMISSLAPTSGPLGTSVTLTGTSLTGATSVSFNGVAATYTVNSAAQITATVPNGATTGAISVTTPGGTVTSAATFTVTVVAPTLSSFTPASGPVGTSVTIAGTNFLGTTVVKFNATTATYTVNSATQITATVPTGATSGMISVTTPGGTATSATSFTVTVSAIPTIAIITPTSGPVGTSVILTGTNFLGATAVKFNATTATYTVNSATQITTTVPNGATTGPISVTTPGGTASSGGYFTVTAAAVPTISNFTPTSGPIGTSVTITGTNLTGTSTVTFNNTAAPYAVNSATQVTTTVPNGATTGPISVTTPGGTANSGYSFTVLASSPPTISTIAPGSGPVGTSVTLTGTNLTGTSAVSFNGVTATYIVNSATQITATVPSGASTGTISVTTPGGSATSGTAFSVTVITPVSITGQPADQSVAVGQTATFTVTASGSGPIAYQWYCGTVAIPGATAASYTTAATTLGDNGTTFYVTVSNSAGGANSRQALLRVGSSPAGVLTWTGDIIYLGTKEVAEIDANGVNVTLTDHLGSPRFEVRGDGSVIEQKFAPFGESLADPATMSKFAKGFTNHEQTDPSGLIYMQARFYLPMYHRFASPDPARDQHFEQTQSWNIYSYVQNNPVMMTDPTGMWTWGGVYDTVLDGAAAAHVGIQQIPVLGTAYAGGARLGEAISGSKVEYSSRQGGPSVTDLSLTERSQAALDGTKAVGLLAATAAIPGSSSLTTTSSITGGGAAVLQQTAVLTVSNGSAAGAAEMLMTGRNGGGGGKQESKDSQNGKKKDGMSKSREQQQKDVNYITRELKRDGVNPERIKDELHDVLHGNGYGRQEGLKAAREHFKVN